MFFVRIDHLTENDLAFFGFRLDDENDEFKLYVCHRGHQYVVKKDDPYLFVEDVNDASQMKASRGFNF